MGMEASVSKLCSIIGSVVYCNVSKGFSLVRVPASEPDGAEVTIFVHASRMNETVLRGQNVVILPVDMQRQFAPPVNGMVEILGIAEPMPGTLYSQATGWMDHHRACRMEAAADKAAATLAKLAEKAAEENRLRQHARANSCRKGATGGGKKNKQKAGAR